MITATPMLDPTVGIANVAARLIHPGKLRRPPQNVDPAAAAQRRNTDRAKGLWLSA